MPPLSRYNALGRTMPRCKIGSWNYTNASRSTWKNDNRNGNLFQVSSGKYSRNKTHLSPVSLDKCVRKKQAALCLRVGTTRWKNDNRNVTFFRSSGESTAEARHIFPPFPWKNV
eukprot:TRINITY_DN6225_c0_g1_i1.p1 TRINITY_DN6225_c0_g1~~TRINITY_DN6225_c0_g1_i1.p1  ORF type:complete len:114 (-),score=6.45 TRINITY_DN6225_c0_g1_i1:163-504(-)